MQGTVGNMYSPLWEEDKCVYPRLNLLDVESMSLYVDYFPGNGASEDEIVDVLNLIGANAVVHMDGTIIFEHVTTLGRYRKISPGNRLVISLGLSISNTRYEVYTDEQRVAYTKSEAFAIDKLNSRVGIAYEIGSGVATLKWIGRPTLSISYDMYEAYWHLGYTHLEIYLIEWLRSEAYFCFS